MSKLTEDVNLISLQEKRDRILKIHKRLHSGTVRFEEPWEVKTVYHQDTQTGHETPRLNRTDVRKILGDPLPLPYMIDSKGPSNPVNFASSPISMLEPRRLKPSIPAEAHLRLQNSIRNLQKPTAFPLQDTPTQETMSELPIFSAIETPVLKLQHDFKTPSPPSDLTRRITDSHSKDELLKEFRGQIEPEVKQTKTPSQDKVTIAIRIAVFVVLAGCLFHLIYKEQ
jgi:hypothetical protein